MTAQHSCSLHKELMSNTNSILKSSMSGFDITASGVSRSALSKSVCSSISLKSQKEFVSSDGRFTLHTKIGAGAFGQVYQATDTLTGKEVALKLEKKDKYQSQLDLEYRVYKAMDKKVPGIPYASFKGHDGPFTVLALELLGPCLEDLLCYCAGQFISVVRHLHDVGFLHRDLKPENFAMGLGGKANHVYMIDYGLAKKYKDKSGTHVPFRSDKGFTGTARYASMASHQGWEQGRKDDLESLCYVIAYLADGSLPWQGVQAADRAKRKKLIFEKKTQTTPEVLMNKLPCFTMVMGHLKSLTFESEPDYDFLYKCVENDFNKRGYVKDFDYDWFDTAKKFS